MRQDIKDRIEQIRNGEVPEGYKNCKLNVIPKDWKEFTLDKHITIISGKSPSQVEFTDGKGIPYYKVDSLNFCDKWIDKTELMVKTNDLINLAPPKSVLFPKRGAAILTNKVIPVLKV